MQVRIDEELIVRKSIAAKLGSGVGLVLVLSGLFLLWVAWGYPWSYLVVLLGFVIGSVGNRQMNRWVNEPRADQVLSRALRGFDDKHYLYHYLLPADHVLLAPCGLFVIKAKGVEGRIRCLKDGWQRDFSLLRLLRGFAPEPLGNPTKETRREMERLTEYIAQRLPGEEVEVKGMIVFTHPQVQLEARGATLPTMRLRGLKSYLRKAAHGGEMPEEIRKELVRIFDEAAS
ncbi:MAG: nuclease-related domain-containing protein [Anaerolineae bacterium]